VVDAVIVEEPEIRNRRKIEDAHKIDWGGKLFRGQGAHPGCGALEILVIPIDQFGHGLGLVFFLRRFHGELKVGDCIEELDITVGQVPRQLPRCARIGIGLVLSFGIGNGGDDLLSDFKFPSDAVEHDFAKTSCHLGCETLLCSCHEFLLEGVMFGGTEKTKGALS
jgi:hypothetical protein